MNHDLIIRQETEKDFNTVFNLIEKAFQKEELSDHKEHFLVERLRKSTAFIPELSLVALIDETIVGHILLTKIKIRNKNNVFNSLALAPVSVLPNYQRQGIGSTLILEAHKKALELEHTSIVLLGHQTYYPRFGYKQAHNFNIKLPFEVPKENCMVKGLVADALKNINGIVEYPKEFME